MAVPAQRREPDGVESPAREGGERGRRQVMRLVQLLWLVDAAVLVVVLAVWKRGEQPFREFLELRSGKALVVAGAVASLALAGIWRRVHAGRLPRHGGRLALLVSVVSLLVGVGAAELTIRALVRPSPQGESLLGAPLRPHEWTWVARRNLAILAGTTADGGDTGFFVHDPLLGWTVGPERRSRDGLHFSDAHGIRSAGRRVSETTSSAQQTVALVGDSFTFGQDVEFADSWGKVLSLTLAPGVRVLNFGVGGYGVDQAYLRYLRDVRPWAPDLVILGFIRHDLFRSASIYTFITYPLWGFPFSKPRLLLDGDGGLRALNLPVRSPQELFRMASVSGLPFIELDIGWDPDAWRRRAYHASHLVRLITSRLPRWRRPHPVNQPDALRALNEHVITAFVEAAREAGSIPLVVYMPSRATGDFAPPPRHHLGLQVLAAAGDDALDLSACVAELPAGERLLRSGHYTPRANHRVAECLAPRVRRLLGS